MGFNYSDGHWTTLGDADIDGVLIAACAEDRDLSKILTYPVIDRATVLSHFEAILAAYAGEHGDTPPGPYWIGLDHPDPPTNRIWDAGSGLVADLTPIARYASSEPDAEPEPEIVPEPKPGPKPRGSISMTVDLDPEEHSYLAERYGRKLEVDPRRLLVEVRLTFLT